MSIIRTGDGSQTVKSKEFGVTYHSIHGALEETNHVFIDAGLKSVSKGSVRIFEMGLGTGLNVLATFQFASATGISIDFTSIEAYPLSHEIISELDYQKAFDFDIRAIYQDIHDSNWDKVLQLDPNFRFTKHHGLLEDYVSEAPFDLIYYDAFAPTAQPELWNLPTMQKMFEMLEPGGILVTYCAQGQFKRNLKSAGFDVQVLPGPPRKREMTKAIKPQ